MRSLPDKPDLAQLRRQAKELLRGARVGERGAAERIRAVSRRQDLSAAQLALAREYGYSSWARLKAALAYRQSHGSGARPEAAPVTIWDPDRARGMAAAHLATRVPDRWAHARGAAARARQVASALDPIEGAVLTAAAWLHDIGYAPALRRTGAHQLDGAAFLREAGQERLAALVAHHSESRFELGLLGLADRLATYADEDSAVSQALTYCDVMTGPDGSPLELWEALDEVRERYGAEHVRVRAQDLARPYVHLAVADTELRLPDRLRTPPAQETTTEYLRQSLEAMRAARWTRRLTLWVRDLGKVVHPYCYTTGDELLYVHRPAWGVIAIYRAADILHLEEVPVPERRVQRDTDRFGAQEWRVTVHVMGRAEPYVFERAHLSFAGDESARVVVVHSAGNVRSVFQETLVKRVTKEVTGIRPRAPSDSLQSTRELPASPCLHQRIAAETDNGKRRVFADAYSVCGTDGITVWHATTDAPDARAHDRLADYRYRDVRMVLGAVSGGGGGSRWRE